MKESSSETPAKARRAIACKELELAHAICDTVIAKELDQLQRVVASSIRDKINDLVLASIYEDGKIDIIEVRDIVISTMFEAIEEQQEEFFEEMEEKEEEFELEDSEDENE